MKTEIRPLTGIRPGYARSRDERFELVRGPNCWQVRSCSPEAAHDLMQLGKPPVCERRRELADWLEGHEPRKEPKVFA